MIEEAILNYTDFDRAIGLCNVPINMHAGIARVLDVDESRLELQLQGVNHFVFATGVFVDASPSSTRRSRSTPTSPRTRPSS